MNAHTLLLEIPSGTVALRRTSLPTKAGARKVNPTLSHIEGALQKALWSQRLAMIDLLGPGRTTLSMLVAPSELVQALLLDLQMGRLELVAPEADGSEESAGDAAWSAYSAFQAQLGREFTVATRSYRLVPRERVESVRREAEFDVVPAAEAISIVGNVCKGKGRLSGFVNELLKNICDMRGPPNEEGFVLLRAPFAQAARYVAPVDVITPAKLKELVADRLKDPRWLAEEPKGSRERGAASASIDDEVYVRATTSGFPKGTAITFVIMDASNRDVVATLQGSVGDGETENMAHARWQVPETIESGTVVPDKSKFLVAAEASGHRCDGGILKVVPSIWELLLQFDPDDPEAQDDELILYDSAQKEVERIGPGEMVKEGRDWVRIKFKNTRRLRRYSLVRDHGPDEGGGADVLIDNMSPDELDALAEQDV